MINPGWAVLVAGVVIAGLGATLIIFRHRIVKFNSSRPFSSPRNSATAIAGGILIALFGAVAIWSGVSQLLALG